MSVRQKTYAIYGAVLPYETADYDTCEPFFPENREAGQGVVLFDGMCGKWIIVGVVSAVDEGEGFNPPLVLPIRGISDIAECVNVLRKIGADPSVEFNHIVVTKYA